MKTNATFTALALVLSLGAAACGDDSGATCTTPDAHNGSDAGSGSGSDGGTNPVTYKQIEHLGRPGIAEALLLSNPFLDGYNSTAPFFPGVDPTTVTAISNEAKVVLHAAFYGVCLLNGALVAAPADGFHPGGVACPAIGGDIFVSGGILGGTVVTQTMKDTADAYANAVFDLFEPDVLRIDTSAPSAYFTLCGTLADLGKQALCGGRKLNEDVIDITYDFLFAGGAIHLAGNAATPQLKALVSDGVSYSKTSATNAFSLSDPDPANSQQFREGVHLASGTFPYSGAPF